MEWPSSIEGGDMRSKSMSQTHQRSLHVKYLEPNHFFVGFVVFLALFSFPAEAASINEATTSDPTVSGNILVWLIFFLAGIMLTVLVFALFKQIVLDKMLWIITAIVAMTGLLLLVIGGILEYRRAALGAIFVVATGSLFLAAASITATLAAKFQYERRLREQLEGELTASDITNSK